MEQRLKRRKRAAIAVLLRPGDRRLRLRRGARGRQLPDPQRGVEADRGAARRAAPGGRLPRHRAARRRSRRWSARAAIAGVILFAENFPSREAGRSAIAELQAIRRPPGLRDPLLVMIDQEGGLVKRIDGAPTASAAQMGARGAAFAREQGARTAANLRDAGVNVDLAPVLDVARPGSDTEETERGFGSSAASVAATAIPFATALQEGGVAATAKHFPGLGSTRRQHRLRGPARAALEGDPARRRRGALPAPSSRPAARW